MYEEFKEFLQAKKSKVNNLSKTEILFNLWLIRRDILFDDILEYCYEGQIRSIDEIMRDILEIDAKDFLDMVEVLIEDY